MSEREDTTASWWTTGDMPVRHVPRVAFLIDGRMTMLEMCCAFLCARRSIHIAAWGMSPEMLLVRGKHKQVGPPGSPEQRELVDWLRSKGLSREAIRFWQQSEALSVASVLGYAVSRGVDVRVLLWNTYTLPFQPGPEQVQEALEKVGVKCLLDDSHMGLLNHPLEAHHQKAVVVDSRLAFVGGIDMMIENNGEYDRWDTKGHHYHTPLRLNKDGKMPHSWHDVHTVFEGEAVADVEFNFRQRWNAVVQLHELDSLLLLPEASSPLTAPRRSARSEEPVFLQVVRTIPPGTYKFPPEEGIATILDVYLRAFRQAKDFIYIENQYFWRRTFLGLENPTFGIPHADMETLMQEMANAIARGVRVALVLPDDPNVGREFTDEGLHYLESLLPEEGTETGALQAYTLGTSSQQNGQTYYRSIYVHAKTTIVDDTWITIGSANLNNRGMRDDTELNVAIMHPDLAYQLRLLLMAEHLGLCHEDTLFRFLDALSRVYISDPAEFSIPFMPPFKRWLKARTSSIGSGETRQSLFEQQLQGDLRATWEKLQAQLGDPVQALALYHRQAQENCLAVKAGRPLKGHLLPYIPHDRAQENEVEVHPVNGWLDTLPVPENVQPEE
ncbi:MAG TPA: phospholipase D family protein [Ktedonobacteraceae bacterium]|jgi:phosphatidylserine/phosphatidylglycerophosphate/cardiolipin synthase-like enzyme|nr:phospholipase D family protein [Ktedonobacteraceae bacterium]